MGGSTLLLVCQGWAMKQPWNRYGVQKGSLALEGREVIRINKVKLAIFEAMYDVIGVAH